MDRPATTTVRSLAPPGEYDGSPRDYDGPTLFQSPRGTPLIHRKYRFVAAPQSGVALDGGGICTQAAVVSGVNSLPNAPAPRPAVEPAIS